MDSIELLKELVRIDSSTILKANEAIDYCSNYLKENGIDGEIIINNGYKSYVSTIGKGEKTLILNGHLDVVSAKESQFTPIEKDGRLIGRGTADMKSGCVAMMQAMIKLKTENLTNKIMLQLVSDEETGGENCTKHLVEENYLGDFVICTEPTNLKVSIQSKGIIRMDIISHGISAHGSRPWEGENAILKSYENFSKIKELEIMNIGSEFYEGTSINLAVINGGDIYNRVPDKCTIGLDIRYVPNLDPKEIIESIKEVVDGDVVVSAIEPGVYGEPTDSNIKLLSESLIRILPDAEVEYVAQHGGSDGRYYAKKGIPVVEFGAKGNYWHGDDEYVEMESVYQLEKVLIDFIRRY
ncbi:ArgE/DapE family deacylase [Clostridiaceae bacterium HSG29]|nr:ArgE/DapE family deacylase [Clostridiaceae bacterium HSG29]